MTTRKFRDQHKKDDEADLKRGQLPPDFERSLTFAEAKTVLDARIRDHRAPFDLDANKEITTKTQAYIEEFDPDTDDYHTTIARKTIWRQEYSVLEFTDFEMSELLLLRPTSADEARKLIVSFERFDADDELVATLEQALHVIRQPVARS